MHFGLRRLQQAPASKGSRASVLETGSEAGIIFFPLTASHTIPINSDPAKQDTVSTKMTLVHFLLKYLGYWSREGPSTG